ncbi:hypothetical protein U1769_06730 [Sphingomonas sp. ZT3P38]|uniref:hypothetical protein n=1 Tax=Parasphingomonas zepuensis TaxID=3096161 RepID=UPI002FCCA162
MSNGHNPAASPVAGHRAPSQNPGSSATTGETATQDGSPTTDRRYETRLEIAEAATVIIEAIKASADGGITADDLLDRLDKVQKVEATAEQAFPSQIFARAYRCGGYRDGIRDLVFARYCGAGNDGYTQVIITSFLHWSTFSAINDGDSITRYLDRTNAFTISQIAEHLKALGYHGRGIVVGQSIVLGLPTPLVHTGFTHDGAAPVIAVGHRPEIPPPGFPPTPSAAVIEIRLYFPGRVLE